MSYNPHHDSILGGLVVPVNGPLGQGIQVMTHLLSDEIALHLYVDMVRERAKDHGIEPDAAVMAASAYHLADVLLAERASRMAAAKLAEAEKSK